MNPIQLSIIIPTFNSGKTLHACLKSIADQNYKHVEVLIIDGVSTDDTIEIANMYKDSIPRLHIISEPDNGIYDAMNKGAAMANGEWLFFLGSDDIFYSNDILECLFVKHQIDFESNDFVYGNVLWGDTNSVYLREFTMAKLFTDNICHQAIFVRKHIFEKLEGFDIRYKIYADWHFNLRCFADNSIKIKYMNVLIAKFSLNGISGTREDLFLLNKKTIIKGIIKKQPLLVKTSFNLLEAARPGWLNKFRFIYFYFIYIVLMNVDMMRDRQLHTLYK